jgi:hypothetical protein
MGKKNPTYQQKQKVLLPFFCSLLLFLLCINFSVSLTHVLDSCNEGIVLKRENFHFILLLKVVCSGSDAIDKFFSVKTLERARKKSE